ncbi:hypothetical protein BJ878DRAFT_538028 [Calycina marina]|uniref:Uncharacterized protein n=1 Tax=Calycina marina TaxID=1763456 RepID=A0A9P7ZBF3_9HELO|nr:hypothetical protein BJ878DRAFT_538028 [Calycina marina]
MTEQPRVGATGMKLLKIPGMKEGSPRDDHSGKKAQWEDFFTNDTSIRQAAKYSDPHDSSAFDKIPPKKRQKYNQRQNGTSGRSVISVLFPPPARIEDEGPRPQRTAVSMPPLTMEE